jgi:hypothetical protein
MRRAAHPRIAASFRLQPTLFPVDVWQRWAR